MDADALQYGLDRVNEESPPTYYPSPFLAIYRHLCLKTRQAQRTGKGISTAIDLKERYVTGWEQGKPVTELDAVLAIIYKEGSCKHCGQVARSRAGRIVEVADRPPVTGRVARA